MLGYILNMSNVNADSQVLMVEHTRGMVAGALMERGPKYIQRVEYSHSSIKINSEILEQFDLPGSDFLRLGSVHGNLFSKLGAQPDPLMDAMRQQFIRKFNVFVMVHDEILPIEVWSALKDFLQPNASFCIHSIYL